VQEVHQMFPLTILDRFLSIMLSTWHDYSMSKILHIMPKKFYHSEVLVKGSFEFYVDDMKIVCEELDLR
jgi:hypothetical protein